MVRKVGIRGLSYCHTADSSLSPEVTLPGVIDFTALRDANVVTSAADIRGDEMLVVNRVVCNSAG